MALSFAAAAERYQQKFPSKQLVTFTTVKGPCTVRCEIHGEQSVTQFHSVMTSVHGCPVCGKEASKNKRTARLSGRATTAEVLARASRDPLSKSLSTILDAWPQTWAACHDVLHSQMRKGEIIEEVERLLLAYDKTVKAAQNEYVEIEKG